MKYHEFVQSLKQDSPPEIANDLLVALWHDGKDNWEAAHNLTQEVDGTMACWIHAYLHRKEGDRSNAGYWYHRAGKIMPDIDLEEEWEILVKELI